MQALGEPARLPDWLAHRARAVGERPAVRWEGRVITFGALDRLVEVTARQLLAAGVRAGDRVAVLARGGLGFIRLVHAMSRTGSILVPLNYRLAAEELAWQLADATPRLLLCDDEHLPMVEELARRIGLPAVFRVLQGTEEGAPGEASEAAGAAPPIPCLDDLVPAEGPLRRHVELDAIHTLLYTSGTTGKPKAAMLSYGNHWWSAVASSLNLGLRSDDAWLACLPLFHAGGLSILFRSVIYGITVTLHTAFDPDAVNRAIDAGEATMISLVSAMLERILAVRGDRPFPKSLRAVLLGGGPTPIALLDACRRYGLPAVNSYGMTETASQVAAVPLSVAPDLEGSAGQPLLPVELRIGHPEDPAPPGEVGEVFVRGPMVTRGYWRRPEATQAAFVSGWFRTGDLGYLAADGRLFIVNRRDDLIISGGENVYPAEVEAVLRGHPDVVDVAVIPAASSTWGQVPVAVLVLREGSPATAAALRAYCRERLAGYKVPKAFHVVAELPRNAAGKVLRRELRAAYGTVVEEERADE